MICEKGGGLLCKNCDANTFGNVLDPKTNTLHPKMMTQTVTAPELLNYLVCMCEDGCEEQEQQCNIPVAVRLSY